MLYILNCNSKYMYFILIELLYRSDFFPGLGWMLKREVWQELSPKWPAG